MLNTVERYIAEYNLKSVENDKTKKYPTYFMVYKLYLDWCVECCIPATDILDRSKFNYEFRKFFNAIRKGSYFYALVETDKLIVTDETLKQGRLEELKYNFYFREKKAESKRNKHAVAMREKYAKEKKQKRLAEKSRIKQEKILKD